MYFFFCKLFLFFLSYPRLNGTTFSQKYEAAQQFSTLIIIRNVSWAANLHIRIIAEGSCDIEDWINDAKNSALITSINYILLYSRIEDSYFKL